MADITALCQRVLVIDAGRLIYDGSLEGLLERFSPYREVTIELAQEHALTELQIYGDLKEMDGRVACFLVPQEHLTQTIAKLLDRFEIVDLTVTEPPIEAVIGQVFQSGRSIESSVGQA
jgi:ABC-2 type transport system ATP-binding protein